MVEQEAVNFEVAGSSPAVGAMKRRVLVALFFMAPMFDWVQKPQSGVMQGCGYITKSKKKLQVLFYHVILKKSYYRFVEIMRWNPYAIGSLGN